jgi:hypothetical protein
VITLLSFDDLVHKILAHDPISQPVVVTSRFIDELHEDIRVVVLIQRRSDLDTASSIILLQKELTIDIPQIETKKSETIFSY